jgi:hypothetical protein
MMLSSESKVWTLLKSNSVSFFFAESKILLIVVKYGNDAAFWK